MMQTQDYIREFFTIFFIQGRIIGLVTVVALGIGIAIILFAPSQYSADSAIVIKGSRALQSPTEMDQSRTSFEPIRESDLFSEMEILSSQRVFMQTARHFAENDQMGLGGADENELREFAGKIEDRFSTSLSPRSNIIKANLTWSDPRKAERLLDQVLQSYLAHRTSVYNPEGEVGFFKDQLTVLRESLHEQEQRLMDITDGAGPTEIEQQIKDNSDLISHLERKLTEIQSDQVEQAKSVEQLQETLSGTEPDFFTALDNLPLSDLSKKVQQLYVDKADLLQTYLPQSSQAQSLEEQITWLQGILRHEARTILEQKRSNLQAMEQQIAFLNKRIQELKAENSQLNRQSVRANRIQREMGLLEESVSTFARRYREARLRNQTESDRLFNVGLVKQANASSQATFPRATRVFPLSLGLGILLGLTIGFLLEFFDHRFKRPEDVTTYAGVPCIFYIPDYG